MFLPLVEKDLPFLLSAVQCFWFFFFKCVAKCKLLLKRNRDFFCIVNNCVIQYEIIAWVTCLVKTEVHVLGKCYFVFLYVVLFKLNFLTAGLRWLVAWFFFSIYGSKLVSQPSPLILHCSSISQKSNFEWDSLQHNEQYFQYKYTSTYTFELGLQEFTGCMHLWHCKFLKSCMTSMFKIN